MMEISAAKVGGDGGTCPIPHLYSMKKNIQGALLVAGCPGCVTVCEDAPVTCFRKLPCAFS